MSDIIEVFEARRSVRSYTDEQIPDELLRQIVRDWGVPEDYQTRAHASLGYPQGGFPEPVSHDKYVPPLFVS